MRQNHSESDPGGGGSCRLAFSKRRLEAVPVPQGRRVYYHDTQTAGLTLCVTPTGAKTFYFRRWCNGNAARIPLGKFPAMSVEQAQKQAKVLIGQIAAGADPQATRQAARHEHTIAGLWGFWITHAKQRKKAKSWGEDERQYNAFLKPWAGRRLSTVRKADVAALHARIGQENGIYAANRMLALLRAMFNKAPDMGFRGDNPTTGIKKFPEEKRDRFLHGDDLRSFFASLAEEPNTLLQHFFVLLLFTGARRSNVQAMRWDEIDFATASWRTPITLAILRDRKEAANGTPWVFPSRGRQGHIVEPKSAWKRIIKRAGLVDVRPHDLRRSLGSWMAIGGASLPLIGKMLGHTQPSTTAIYARLSVDPVRQAAEKAEADMLQAAGLEWDGVKLLTEGNHEQND
jgi:integrase